MKRICTAFAFMSVFIMTSCVMTPPVQKSAVLVVPSRYTVVQIAFDMLRLRPLTLVAYDSDSDPESPVMHIWHGQTRQWLRTTKGEYESGAGIGSSPSEVIVVGSELDLPPGLSNPPPWCENVRVIPTLRISDLINELDKSLDFTKGEWRWLAARHRLTIVDHNAERRRYGRYGKPGSRPNKRASEAPKETVMPTPIEQETLIVPLSPIDDPTAPAVIEEPKAAKVPVALEPDMAPEDK